MIPRLRPALGPADLLAALIGQGDLPQFERAFASTMEQGEAIAFPYGRTALLLLIEALGFKGRDIILPAYTCVVVAHAVVLSGNRPVFIDSVTDGFNMDLDQAEAAITARTGALIITSIHGYPVDLDRLDILTSRHPHVTIIQDCAHSFAAEWRGRAVQKAGRAAIFGLNISKLMTSVFGGMVTTDDATLAERLRQVRQERLRDDNRLPLTRAIYLVAATTALSPAVFGLVNLVARLGLIDRFVRYYDETQIDMPPDYLVQIGKVEAVLGLRQCKCYRAIVAKRQAIASYYNDALADLPTLTRPPLVEGATYSHYVIRVEEPERWLKAAAARSLELGRLIEYCVPDMPAYSDMTLGQGPFDVTRKLNRTVLNVPIWVDRARAEQVVQTLQAIAKHPISV